MYIRFNERIVEKDSKRKFLLILITIFPLLFGGAMYWLNKEHLPIYRIIGSEDNLIEWLQFLLFGASGIISFILALKFRKKSKLMFWIFLFLSLGLIFVAGEEISWGERLFGIEAPYIFDGETKLPVLNYNVQSEMNIHNFKAFHKRVGYMYLAIGAYACFAWVLLCIANKVFKFKKSIRKYLPFFTVPPYLVLYFFPLAINLLPRRELGIAPQDYEMAEFLLSLGVFICVLLYYEYFKETFGKESSK